ncbi:PP2C family protein-serine/threonine phosphatase [Sulfitobacter sp. SK011]|uniref:PP2C family protein-serine/threonine phosphatase n=1 Tax=Sulfitobacter sp. SK011 TaxID=1389004 RepID=UPI0020C7F056|nr:SpoIIE family protein phosphatase [Sulfitobacter sp. SK011]
MARFSPAFAHPGGDANSSKMKLVLVVDDSRLQRRILAKSLVKWGFEVEEAESGEAAIAFCKSWRPDLILSDWMMPGMSGLEFCRAFRELSDGHYAYFILLTSKSEKEEVARGLDSGADDFLTKPVDNNELRARITAGERILHMQRELSENNRLISDTLDELQRVYDSLDKDLLEAKKLQQSLLRERHKTFDQGTLSLMLRSSGHVGGDLVGFFPAGLGQLGLFAIDVSGHGISSALMTARLAGYLSATAPDQNVALERKPDGRYAARPTSEVIATLNDLVLNEMETEHYFTLMLAVVDLNTGRVTIGQAGHPHPAIQRRDGSIVQTGTGGFPVGLLSGISFEQFDVQLESGDRLLILSDGVTECPDPAGQLLGEDGLERIMVKLRDVKGTALLEALIWELTDFAGGADFPDDVSGILFEYSGVDQRP